MPSRGRSRFRSRTPGTPTIATRPRTSAATGLTPTTSTIDDGRLLARDVQQPVEHLGRLRAPIRQRCRPQPEWPARFSRSASSSTTFAWTTTTARVARSASRSEPATRSPTRSTSRSRVTTSNDIVVGASTGGQPGTTPWGPRVWGFNDFADSGNNSFRVRLTWLEPNNCGGGYVEVDQIRVRVNWRYDTTQTTTTTTIEDVDIRDPYNQTVLFPQRFWAGMQSQGAPARQGDAFMTQYDPTGHSHRNVEANTNYCPFAEPLRSAPGRLLQLRRSRSRAMAARSGSSTPASATSAARKGRGSTGRRVPRAAAQMPTTRMPPTRLVLSARSIGSTTPSRHGLGLHR